MIKGLAITPPLLGRISIGRVVEKNGKRLPEKDDQFTITTQIQTKEGWLNHPLDAELRQTSGQDKLRIIPVQLLFNDPDLNLRVEYTFFDRENGRPVCVGNGETCKRRTSNGMEALSCPSPQSCEFGKNGLCKPYGRLNVQIGNDDELGSFIFRTTGFNSIRTLAARLHYYQAVSGNRLACLPLALKLRGKSTTQSFRTAIYYVDITLRDGMALADALAQASELQTAREACGFQQTALDDAGRQGFANAAFEFSDDEIPAIVEEFYPDMDAMAAVDQQALTVKSATTLKSKLIAKPNRSVPVD